MLTTIVSILFALLATVTPSDIPIRFEILGASATYTNTEEMFDANPSAYGITDINGRVVESSQTAQEPHQDDPGDLSFRVYLPSANMAKPAQKLTTDGVSNATGLGTSYLEWMTGIAEDQGKRVTHEYPAMPLWLMVDGKGVYMPGLRGADISWFAVSPKSELSTITFDLDYDGLVDLRIWADRKYFDNAPTEYQFMVAYVNPNYNQGAQVWDLFMGEYKIFDNITRNDIGDMQTVTTDNPQPALRYTLRHASRLAYNLFSVVEGETLRDGLSNMLDAHGFTLDLYDPVFGLNKSTDPAWLYTAKMYHDCEVTLPRGAFYNGTWSAYYGYDSKVCRIGVTTYTSLTKLDYLVPMLQAVQVLNQTGNPYARFRNGLGQDVSPLEVARWIEQTAWNGYGVRIWGKDPAIASSVRTDVFLVLETLLGYKYGDATSAYYADEAARIVAATQIDRGGWIWTDEDGSVLRPTQRGGQLVAWRWVVAEGETQPRYQMPARTILTDILDMVSMPVEVQGVLATNSESTGLMVQSLRVYGAYALNMNMQGGMMP